MRTHANGKCETKTWDEKPYGEVDVETKLTRATVTTSFQGDIEGEGTSEYLMAYSDKTSGSFVGLERVKGRIAGRSGGFVLQHMGQFGPDTLQSAWSVVPGTATADLRGLKGKGTYTWKLDQGHTTLFTFEYDLE
jgi:Protein of unknown function (DUF3224)